MILDSEAQRKQLLDLLAQVPLSTSIGNIEEQAQLVTGILQPIRDAEIVEEQEPSADPDGTPDISPDNQGDPGV